MLVCAYLPYAWVLLYLHVRYYGMIWLENWPILPSLQLTCFFPQIDDATTKLAGGLITLLAIGLATVLAARRRLLIPVTVLILSAINSWIAYALFRA